MADTTNAVIQAVRNANAAGKIDELAGLASPETLAALDALGSSNHQALAAISVADLRNALGSFGDGTLSEEDIFGSDACTQGTDTTCTLTVRPCPRTG